MLGSIQDRSGALRSDPGGDPDRSAKLWIIAEPGVDEARISAQPAGTSRDFDFHVRREDQATTDIVNGPSGVIREGLLEYKDVVRLHVDGMDVSLRKSDCSLCATEIISMAGKGELQRRRILEKLNTGPRYPGRPSWISFEEGERLCDELELTSILQSLFKVGQELKQARKHQLSQDPEEEFTQDREQQPDQDPKFLKGLFVPVRIHRKTVMVRRMDLKVNATHIFNVAKLPRQRMTQFRKVHRDFEILTWA